MASAQDPYGWEDIAADTGGYYDMNADPYGIAQYMTPQFPNSVSTSKFNYGQENPNSIEAMAKKGNTMQDYYKILSDPVTQWLNMVTTGGASLDLNSLIGGGGGGMSPYIQSLQSSDDQYLQTIGRQLASEAAPETVKLQMRQIPELADDPEKLKVYDAAVDNAYKDKITQKAEGPVAQFEKLGLTNPLTTYGPDDLPGDVAADKGMIARLYGQGSDERMQWEEYGNHYRDAAEMIRRQNEKLKEQLGQVDVTTPEESRANAAKTKPGSGRNPVAGEGGAYYAGGGTKYSPGGQKQNPSNKGWIEVRMDPAHMSLDANNKRLKEYESRAKEAERYKKGPQRATVDEIVSGVNKIRAMQLQQQGRTPARDQARSMMSWLQSQNYG